MADPVVLERPRLGRLYVRLRGPLDAATGALLCAALREALAVTGDVTEVVLDLRAVDDVTAGHAALLAAQGLIARAGLRSAHIVARPRVRGLVMRVCHELDDPGARPVPSEAMAEAWLARHDALGFADASFAQAERLLAGLRGRGVDV